MAGDVLVDAASECIALGLLVVAYHILFSSVLQNQALFLLPYTGLASSSTLLWGRIVLANA